MASPTSFRISWALFVFALAAPLIVWILPEQAASANGASPLSQATTAGVNDPSGAASAGSGPLVEVTSSSIPSATPVHAGNSVVLSCSRPTMQQHYGTVMVSNLGTATGTLKLMALQYSGGIYTTYLNGTSCSSIHPHSSVTLYVRALPTKATAGSYYDGWFVLTSGSETNVFSSKFT